MGQVPSRPFQISDNGPLNVGFRDFRATPSDGLIPARKLNDQFGFFKGLFQLVSQKMSWSPAVITGEFWRYLINIGMRREVLRLLGLRPYAEFVQNNRRFAFKYLAPNYLARGFTIKERASCFLHHYRRMYAALPENVLYQILQGEVTLHEIAEGGNRFTLSIGSPELIGDREGELSLDIQVDGRKVFNLSFTIVPGWVVKSEAPEILLITRLQGTSRCRPQIRLARKAFHEYFPGKLLLSALQGIADAFEVDELGAICATRQRAYSKEYSAILKGNYDDFFAKVGMVKTGAGFYSGSVPIKGRPLASFKGRNRTRARKRRAVRQQVQSACTAFLLGAADQVALSSSVAVNSIPIPGAVEPQPDPASCPRPNRDLTSCSDLQLPD
jgi:uncharacterized protein VirK/YbjX